MIRAGAGELADGIRAENMLLRQDVAVCPQPGNLLKAARQGAEPLGGRAHRYIPVPLRTVGFVQLPHLVHTPANNSLHVLLTAQNQHCIAGEIPPEEDVLRVLQKMRHQTVPDSGSRFGIGFRHGTALRHGGHQRNVIRLRPQIQIQLFGLLINLLHRQLPCHDPLEKAAAGVLLIVLCFLVELGKVVLLRPFPPNFFPHFLQHRHQGALGNGFE